MIVTATSSEIPMQSLIHHTICRTIEAFDAEIGKLCENAQEGMNIKAIFHFAAGQDGSSNHSRFNQKLDQNPNDNSLFAVQVNPLCMVTEGGAYIYINLAPQSPRSVRPQKLIYAKETKEMNEEEYKKAKAALDDMKENYQEQFHLQSGNLNAF